MALQFIKTKERWDAKQPINGVRHPRDIESKWTKTQLAKIGLEKVPAHEPAPPIDPLTQPVTRVQFKAVLRIAGLYDAVVTAINSIEDPTAKAVAITKFEDSDSYDRDDPLFVMIAPAIGVTDEEIDALWVQAQGIV